MELLKDMGLEPSMMRNNEGCIVLQPADLQAYTARWVSMSFGLVRDRLLQINFKHREKRSDPPDTAFFFPA